jgi:hypothetical protein
MALTTEEIQRWKESPIHRLLPHFKGCLLHRTSLTSFGRICESGWVHPYQDGFSETYSVSAHGYGRVKGYVCLFDLDAASDEENAITYLTWRSFLFDCPPVTVVLCFPRQALEASLIPNSAAPKVGDDDYKLYIPFVEAWSGTPLPLTAVGKYCLIVASSYDEPIFEIISADATKKEWEEAVERLSAGYTYREPTSTLPRWSSEEVEQKLRAALERDGLDEDLKARIRQALSE